MEHEAHLIGVKEAAISIHPFCYGLVRDGLAIQKRQGPRVGSWRSEGDGLAEVRVDAGGGSGECVGGRGFRGPDAECTTGRCRRREGEAERQNRQDEVDRELDERVAFVVG